MSKLFQRFSAVVMVTMVALLLAGGRATLAQQVPEQRPGSRFVTAGNVSINLDQVRAVTRGKNGTTPQVQIHFLALPQPMVLEGNDADVFFAAMAGKTGADQAVGSPQITELLAKLDRTGRHFSLIAIPTERSWGQASTALVQAVYQDQALGVIALDRDSSHLAEQIGVKAFVPVLCISSDTMLTSANIPWVFRLPEGSSLSEAVDIFTQAAEASGANRGKIREFLASGKSVDGTRFESTGEMR